MARLGHPERDLPPVIHVAGTNGKGSTIAFLRAMLEAAGASVHQYTSPHLMRFHERIRLGRGPGQSEFITEGALGAALDECEQKNAGGPITFFEVTTAAAFLAFARAPADVLLLEVGLGGRLDATNLVDRPALSVITPISVDHVGFLGADLAGIAGEKAGICKPGVAAVVGPQEPEAAAAIAARAEEVGAPLWLWGRDWEATPAARGFRVRTPKGDHALPAPALAGRHQVQNAGLAAACLTRLAQFGVDEAAMATGVRSADWPGRLQRLTGALVRRLPGGGEVWLDGGHNPAAAAALAVSMTDLAEADQKPLFLVVGMLETKNAAEFLRAFAGQTQAMVAVPVPGEAAAIPASALAAIGRDTGLESDSGGDVTQALDHIAALTGRGEAPRVLICGSLYLAGAALQADGG